METKTTPGAMVNSMINEANKRGGLDNITAIVVQVLSLKVGNTAEVMAAKRQDGSQGASRA